MHRRATLALTCAALAACFLFAAGTASREACAGDKKTKSAAKKKAKPHLAYQKTYEAALLEARIRNVPVFVSRHKDF